MTGLKRGTVSLDEHCSQWAQDAAQTIAMLWSVLGDDAVDIQHVGSTAIQGLAAKPIIDIVVGMRDISQIMRRSNALAAHGVMYAGQDVPDQRLFVMGDFEKDTRTHHIHVVQWNGRSWNNYIHFRDYLRSFEGRAREYEALKRDLAVRYRLDRAAYTAGKAAWITQALHEAEMWVRGDHMAKALLICGKIASGKSVYAEQIKREENAVMLSVDELVLSILGNDLGGKHDEITDRIQAYLFAKSLEIIRAGANVLLDWGFWTREKRSAARTFYESRGILCEFHYIDTPDEVWRRNIELRNRAVAEGKTSAYFVDEGLMRKLESLFEVPDREEIDVWYVNDWS